MDTQPNGLQTPPLPTTNEPPQFIGKSQATQFKPGQSGNPAGKPKGTKHWSTIVQDLLMDEDFTEALLEPLNKKMPFWDKIPNKNAAKIIASTMAFKAMAGDKKAADWLRKTGFGDKLDITTNDESLSTAGTASTDNAQLFAQFMKQQVTGATEPKPVVSQPVAPNPATQPQAENAAPLPTVEQTTTQQTNTNAAVPIATQTPPQPEPAGTPAAESVPSGTV